MFEDKLINLIKEQKCLYDKSLPSYRNKIKKEKAWKYVAAAVGTEEELCQTRWRSLRDKFFKEIQKSKTNSDSEAPTWRYFHTLMFIKEHATPRKKYTNSNSELEDTIGDNSENTSDVPASPCQAYVENNFLNCTQPESHSSSEITSTLTQEPNFEFSNNSIEAKSKTKDKEFFEDKLIQAVKIHNCLYDKSIASYTNKLKKEKAWADVATAVSTNAENCQTRWRSLRDRFLKELRKRKANTDSEPPAWKYFNALMFMKEHVGPRRTLKNTEWGSEETIADHSENASDVSFVEVEMDVTSFKHSREKNPFEVNQNVSGSSTESTPTSARRAKKVKVQHLPKAGEGFEELVGAIQNALSVRSSEPKSRNENFLKVLDEYLLKIPERSQDILKMKMLNLVFNEVSENISD